MSFRILSVSPEMLIISCIFFCASNLQAQSVEEIKVERAKLREQISMAIRHVENSIEVQKIEEALKEVNSKLLVTSKKLPEFQELEKMKEDMEKRLVELRRKRKSITMTAPEFVEIATQIKLAEEAVRDATRTGKTRKEIMPLHQNLDEMRKKHQDLQSSFPEIRRIDDEISVLTDERSRLKAEMLKVVQTAPSLSSLVLEQSKLEMDLQALRSTESFELKKLRSKDAELRNKLSQLLVEEKNQ